MRKPVKAESEIRVRLTAAQKAVLMAAAARAGLRVSAWLRSLGMREAAR